MKAAFSKWCLNNARKAVDGETADLLSSMGHRVSDCIRGIVMGYGKDAMNGGSTLLQQTATGRGVGRPFNYDFTRGTVTTARTAFNSSITSSWDSGLVRDEQQRQNVRLLRQHQWSGVSATAVCDLKMSTVIDTGVSNESIFCNVIGLDLEEKSDISSAPRTSSRDRARRLENNPVMIQLVSRAERHSRPTAMAQAQKENIGPLTVEGGLLLQWEMGYLSPSLVSAFGRRLTTGNGVSRHMKAGWSSQQPCILGCDLSLGHLQCGSAISVQLNNSGVLSVCNLTDGKMGSRSFHLLRSTHPRLLLASNSILHDFRLLISSQGIENGGVGRLISEDRQYAWVSADKEGGGGVVSGMDFLAINALDWEKIVITLCLRAFLANGIVERAHNGVVIGNEIWDYLYDLF